MMERKRENLRMYYRSLKYKVDVVRKIAGRCGVSRNAVINWMNLDCQTKDMERLAILSEETGIPVEDLFNKTLEEV